MNMQYLSVIPALVLILMLIVGLALLVKRYAPSLGQPSSLLKVRASMGLGGKERVVLLQAGEAVLLLGVSPGQVQTLHVLDPDKLPELESASGEAASASFAAVLQSLNRK